MNRSTRWTRSCGTSSSSSAASRRRGRRTAQQSRLPAHAVHPPPGSLRSYTDAMRVPVLGVLSASLLAAGWPAAADVPVTIENGTVSVSGTDATTRQILTEWARVGQTRIINVERVAGAPVSLELMHVPEAQ